MGLPPGRCISAEHQPCPRGLPGGEPPKPPSARLICAAGAARPVGLPIANNEDLATCRACGGKCCKTLPGAYLPDQLTDDELASGLATGRLVLAWWDGDPRPGRNCLDVD